jgi:hypothetical protein
MFTEYWIIIVVLLLAALSFVSICIGKKLEILPPEGLKEYFYFKDDRTMNVDHSLDLWSVGSISVYYEHIKRDYDRYTSGEERLMGRAISLLAVNGVILTLIAAFIINVLDNSFVLYTSVLAMMFIFISVLFIIWGLHPKLRDEVSMFSHQTDYRWHGTQHDLTRKILIDLLFSLESLRTVYVRKVRRFWGAMFFFTTAMITIMAMFCLLLLT